MLTIMLLGKYLNRIKLKESVTEFREHIYWVFMSGVCVSTKKSFGMNFNVRLW